MKDERLLEGVKSTRLSNAFNGRNIATFELDSKCKARQNPLAIHENSAGTACPLIAALLRTMQFEVVPQEVQQRRARVELDCCRLAVDHDLHWGILR
jgi:hypothetical protein